MRLGTFLLAYLLVASSLAGVRSWSGGGGGRAGRPESPRRRAAPAPVAQLHLGELPAQLCDCLALPPPIKLCPLAQARAAVVAVEPCESGNIPCVCRQKATNGMFADPEVGCQVGASLAAC